MPTTALRPSPIPVLQTGLGPFAPFDPLNMRSDETRLKELKNGEDSAYCFDCFDRKPPCRPAVGACWLVHVRLPVVASP